MKLFDSTKPVLPSDIEEHQHLLYTPEQFMSHLRQPDAIRCASTRLFILRLNTRLRFSRFATRCLDLAGACSGLLLLSPLLLLTAAAIRIESPGPILFSQTRVGLNGRNFIMYKFRSMSVNAEDQKAALAQRNESKDGVLFKMKADPRITYVGKIIRRLSIDELPQLLNIVKGDMSIVGPRPPVPGEVAQYDSHARKRLQTKPGLTCIWQISGRSDIPFKQQVDLDLCYMQSRSFNKNIAIIARTVPAVITGKGAY